MENYRREEIKTTEDSAEGVGQAVRRCSGLNYCGGLHLSIISNGQLLKTNLE